MKVEASLLVLYSLVYFSVESSAVDQTLEWCLESETTEQNVAVFLKDYRPPEWIVNEQVKLDFYLDPDATTVQATIPLMPTGAGDILELDGGDQMDLRRLMVDGEMLFEMGNATSSKSEWSACVHKSSKKLRLTRGKSSDPVVLETTVTIYPINNTELFGLYASDNLLVTQNEAWGFRQITYYLDRPDVHAIFDVTATANRERYPVILSNGNLVSSRNNTDGTHTVRFIDPFPKPSYLFALVAGRLEAVEAVATVNLPCVEAISAFREISIDAAGEDDLAKYCVINDAQREADRWDVVIKVWGRPGTANRLTWALNSVYKAMLWDEIVYGRVYDLDVFHVVAVSDFNAGAMENKGLNIFNIALIEALPGIATDAQYTRIRGVIAHEYFHNWSGDRVTLRDWFQLTLKEGFTVFRDQVFTEDICQSSVKRVQDAKFMMDIQFPQDASPLSHPIRPPEYQTIENFYTVTVYEKGAEIVRMLQTLLGWRAFRRGTDFYFDRYDGSGATCEDFLGAMERASDRNLEQFKLWYSVAGTPQVAVVDHEWDEDSKRYSLVLRQTVNSTSPLLIPIKFALFTKKGAIEQLTPEVVIEFKDWEEAFVFEEIAQEPVPSVLRGFSAPVVLKPFLSEMELLRLATHDNDGYVRWQSIQTVMSQAVKQKLQLSRLPPHKNLMMFYQVIFKRILNDQETDFHLLSYILRLPSVPSFEEHLNPWIPERLHEVLLSTKRDLTLAYKPEMMQIISDIDDRLDQETEYNVNPLQVGLRALRNLLLSILSKDWEDKEVQHVLKNQLTESSFESERAAALMMIADYPASEWKSSLIEYYFFKNHDEPILVNRWMAAQASSTASDTIERVQYLMKSELYANSTTPNRLRSLMNTFATNPVWFHETSGRGYEIVADEVIRWDTFNAKIAARLATSFSHSKNLPVRRRLLIKKQLERILHVKELSVNTKEISSKILKALRHAHDDKRSEL
eukprot:Gregarina_sp_Poly_1__7210@NODE_395_length_8945_cov_457_404145_g316_i1_p1_GENE_NODE_395_length_8945_cov_457_404145_g316_i1NODE_395_length_8945_cov_457_404145_g316_i1_p1_ORF_typecomplete_len968_score162_21DUF3458_C/PF17432_2/9_7e02DUF3458_C/PF17432_2/6_5e69Peptidase_M1/PF01433_20/7_1e51DUF3458/PF11940_8/2_3e21Peptidase_M1_N/PF17900_1/3_1e19Peptidase_M61/PF05299_12/0_048DUF2268/PF10026_9/0_044_NODE_395_length_8945_cov_457_404145_g316_i137376640